MREFFRASAFFQMESVYEPLVDMYETADSLVFEVDLPGIDPGDVLIKVCDDTLMVEGIRRVHECGKRIKYICMERNTLSFRRILKMPAQVDASSGKAMYINGVLTLKFPKLREKVVKIRIEKE
jgi:HSP20 family protein